MARASLAVSTGTAENSGPGIDILVADLDKKAGGSFSAMATLSSDSAEIGDEKSLKEAAAHSAPVE